MRLVAFLGSASTIRLVTVAMALLLWLSAVALAVGTDKALYVGGTVKNSTPRPPRVSVGKAPTIEGRINLTSDSEFMFTPDRGEPVAVRYQAIASLEYGIETGRHTPKGALFFFPWDPIEQFTKNAHNLLTIVYEDGSGVDQAVVFELGKNLVRPVVETLEKRTAKKVEFLNVEACMVFHAADACGYGTPVELKGLTKLFLDDRIPSGDRERISAELGKSAPGVVMVGASNAEISLNYRSARSPNPGCPCEAGRGEVVVTRNGQNRVVLVFTGMKKGVWGQHPAIAFATAVGEALRKAN